MENRVFAHFTSIFHRLTESSKSFVYYMSSPFVADYGEFDILSMECGASRSTFIDPDYDYVVKVETDDLGENNCEVECSIYEAAVRSHLEKCFARPQYIGTYEDCGMSYNVDLDSVNDPNDLLNEDYFCSYAKQNGYELEPLHISVRLYAYPKALIEIPCISEEEDRQASSVVENLGYSPLTDRTPEIGKVFCAHYGEEVYYALTEFCQEHEVNDIHWGNIGTIEGRIVLVDYAGYWR